MLKFATAKKEEEPEDLGTGVGSWLADMLPFMPSGARRTGAAKVMAERVGISPSYNVENPYKSQFLATLGGGVVGGIAMGPKGSVIGTIAALAIVNSLRRKELQDIQASYNERKRKRLRDIEGSHHPDSLFGMWDGSQRLGAASAYESMRKRKYQGFGSLAESGDALRLAAGVSPLTYMASIPVTNMVDSAAATSMMKKSDFSDQKNSPSIPLYLAAGLLSAAGLYGAGKWFNSAVSDTPNVNVPDRGAIAREMLGGNPLNYVGDMGGNAFFATPTGRGFQDEMIVNELDHGYSDADAYQKGKLAIENHYGLPLKDRAESARARVDRFRRWGAIATDQERAGVPVIAHEAGHAIVEQTPGVVRFLQRHVYPHTGLLSTLAGVGSMAAGLATGGTLKGALIGTGLGALGGIGKLAPEVAASYNALKFLKSYQGGIHQAEAKKDLLAALSTYLAGNVLPSTLAGAAGGWIGARRKEKAERELGRLPREEEEEEEA